MKRLFSLLAVLCLTAFGQAQELQRENAQAEGRSVPVSNRSELVFRARNDQNVQTRQLWYRRRQDGEWQAWQRHPTDFGRNTPITWQPPEGHWQVYIQVVQISGLADPDPGDGNRIDVEFIIDRTGPQAQLLAPESDAILSTGQPYTIRWRVEDPHLHSTPVTLSWARDNASKPEVIAAGLPNSGSFTWTTPLDMTNQGRLILTAVDKVLNTTEVASTAIIVDGAPPQCSILGPSRSQSRQIDLQIRAVDSGPARVVESIQLWYSVDDGANWTAGPKVVGDGIETLPWAAANDGEYQLCLVGTDVAGNANALPVAPEDAMTSILIDSQAPIVRLASPIGVRDAEAAGDGSSRRVFKLGDQVLVEFTVEDMRLAEQPIAVFFQSDPDEPWKLLADTLPADRAYLFSLPDISSTQCRVKVQATDAVGNVGHAVSSEPFTIHNVVEHVPVEVEL